MKASELRIGNYVYNHKQIHKIRDGEDIDDHSLYKCHSPISLTEEWLLKFGVIKTGITWHDGSVTNHAFRFNNSKYYIEFTQEGIAFVTIFESYRNEFIKTLEFVHQLQNLYFALTGEELTVKDL